MATSIDAVIAALRIVLRDAEMHASQLWWKTEVVNRWIGQLPGACGAVGVALSCEVMGEVIRRTRSKVVELSRGVVPNYETTLGRNSWYSPPVQPPVLGHGGSHICAFVL